MSTVINTTTTAANYTMKTAYEKQLLLRTKTQWVHAQFGKKYAIPSNNGLIVEMRKSNPYTPSTTDLLLSEGVTPTGQTYGQTRVLATVAQYGAYVTLSDLLDLAGVHHRDAVGHRQGLGLVVRDVDGGDLQIALQTFELEPHLLA